MNYNYEPLLLLQTITINLIHLLILPHINDYSLNLFHMN